MTSVGVVGLGDMGSGIARNLIKNGFETWGIDLIPDRNESFAAIGGNVAETVAEVGRNAQIVFVMVMKGAEAQDVILGVDGLSKNMAVGGVILLTSTVKPSEARSIGTGLNDTGLKMIDSPVSGGYPGAQGGTLTLMVAACDAALEKAKPAMEAVSAAIHRVGTKAGEGQVVKACLQSLIGSIFSATFEAAALAAKAGVAGQVILDVFSTFRLCGITWWSPSRVFVFCDPMGSNFGTSGLPFCCWLRFVGILGSLLVPFGFLWLAFGFLWFPSGSLWLLFGSLWLPFGSPWLSVGSLLAHLWLCVAPFGSLLPIFGSSAAAWSGNLP